MEAFLQQDNTRGNKRPRHGDYSPVSLSSGSSAFETPKTIVSNGLDPAFTLLNTHYGDNTTTAPAADQLQYPDIFTQFLNMEDDNVVPTHIQISYDDFPPGGPGNETDDTPNYTFGYHPTVIEDAPSSVAGQWSEPPGISTVPPPPNQLTKTLREGPTEQEWEERLPLIMLLYGPEKPSLNLTLQELMRVMETAHFLKGATENMYKNRFVKWGIVKNESNAPRRRRTRRQQPATGTSSTPSSSHPHSSTANEAIVTLKDMFENMRVLCVESIQQKHQGTWALDDEFCVADDDWEDAYGSAAALTLKLFKNPDSPAAGCTWGIICDDIAPMVKTLNYFSLPTILIIAFKMCKKLDDAKVRHVAGHFLRGCLEISRAESARSSRHVPLANLLQGLYNVAQHNDVESLADMLELMIPCYTQLVNNYGNSESATALSLLSFYHVQLGSDIRWFESTLSKTMRLLKRAEAEKGEDDKATIEIMGLAIMVLQRTQQDMKLMLLCSKMRMRILRQLGKIPKSHPDRRYYLDRLLDGYHLEIRLAQQDGDEEHVNRLKEEYERWVMEEDKEKDGYAKILDLELEKVTSQLEGTSLASGE